MLLVRQLAERAVHRLSEFGDAGSLFDLETRLADQPAGRLADDRHFITVLIADNIPEDVPRSLAGELRRLDLGGTELGLGLLVVGSVEEVLARRRSSMRCAASRPRRSGSTRS